jgi:hypothetical protein
VGQQALRSSSAAGKAWLLNVAPTHQAPWYLTRSLLLQYGILAGGLADGSICLWNPAAIVDGSGQNPLLSKMQKHAGAVRLLCCSRTAAAQCSNNSSNCYDTN